MTDEKYTFIEDIKQKSSTAKSSHYKKTSGGKHVKFPSDYLSKKEKKKMNGEVRNYDLNKPMSWEKFEAMPDDLEKEYIEKIQERFNVYRKTICKELFHISEHTLANYSRKHGFPSKHGGDRRKKEDISEFRDWIFSKGTMPDYRHKDKKEGPIEQHDIIIEEPKKASVRIPESGTFNYDSINSQELCEALTELLKKNTNYSIRLSFYEINNLKGEPENG